MLGDVVKTRGDGRGGASFFFTSLILATTFGAADAGIATQMVTMRIRKNIDTTLISSAQL